MVKYVLRRLLTAIPTLLLISVLVFVLIDLMPGSYVEIFIASQLEASGMEELPRGQLERLEKRYGLNRPVFVRYWKWFSNFVRGEMGRSWAYDFKPVSELIGERLLLTVIVSLCTILFSFLVAFPVGIYSAVRQYTLADNLFTFVSFIGLAIPNFLLALVFIVIGYFAFDQIPGGLFSPHYRFEPMSIGKFLDLLAHLWIPVVVLGTAGMAGTMRVLRGNMLDQMTQPYVDTARSKGLTETRILVKYPLRIAINPFITGLGLSLPGIVGGELIVSIVLNLPTAGPLLYDAVINHDPYLAGAMVMLLSALLVTGNLLADLTLASVDPRIRFE